MARYDGGWHRGYDRDYGYGRNPAYPGGWGAGRPGRWRGEWGGRGEAPYGFGGYDRGIYGGGYPGFRGYPGAPSPRRYGAYDAPFADGPFIPEEVYRRHPEYDRPQRHVTGRWPDGPAGQGGGAPGYALEDDDVRQLVRESLYGDSWLDADRIDVEVVDGVVTLRGEVTDYMAARYAWDDAWESPGVRGVVNQITVSTGGDTEE